MSVGRIRPSVAALPAYRPGKAADQAEAEHNITSAIKLASNENPYPPAQAVTDAVAAAVGGVNRYPDHLATRLREAIASWVGVDSSQITVGSGSVGLLRQIAMIYVDPGDEVVFPWLSFEAYPIAVTTMGGVPVQVPLVDHGFDLEAVAKAVTDKTKLVMLATPNNPTGTAVDTQSIKKLLEQIPNDVIVLIDEAYREFADPALGDPVTDLLPHHRNAVVFRTFSKAYGLAGLRCGYAIADPDVIVDLDKALLPFANNQLAQVAAMAAIESVSQIQPRIDQLLAERDRVVSELTQLGCKLPDTQANFVWLPLGDKTSQVHLSLEKSGVVTRPFPGEGVRITVGTVEENDRMLNCLRSLEGFG